MITDFIKT